MNKKVLNGFIWFAIAVLVVTSIAKFVSSGGTVRILDQPDPLLKIKYRHLFLGTAVLELAVAGVLVFSRATILRLGLIAWLATNFLIYRLGLWWLNAPKACGCLGTVTDALGIPPKTADTIMQVLLTLLLVGSYSLLFKEWRSKNVESVTDVSGSKPETA